MTTDGDREAEILCFVQQMQALMEQVLEKSAAVTCHPTRAALGRQRRFEMLLYDLETIVLMQGGFLLAARQKQTLAETPTKMRKENP